MFFIILYVLHLLLHLYVSIPALRTRHIQANQLETLWFVAADLKL